MASIWSRSSIDHILTPGSNRHEQDAPGLEDEAPAGDHAVSSTYRHFRSVLHTAVLAMRRRRDSAASTVGIRALIGSDNGQDILCKAECATSEPLTPLAESPCLGW
jgi:hypothetical protein